MKERGGSMAQQTTLSVRIDGSDKQKFEVSVDPFCSEANMTRLKKSIDQLNAGKGKEHELIEVD
ncbi:MAG: type II toxin-antitoxin system antitoxin, RelB/DinJ family [Lachnospiraceae bacterium]|nr:type II toxin-antitoxin system antitoxin, RelB/DinJ family [Lachnospiraceae bacterium]